MLFLALVVYFSCWALQGSCYKRVKMKKNSPNKELLIDWLLTALDNQLYDGLCWSDKQRGLFYVKWVHKSAEQWTTEDLELFKAWAAHKGKLEGKNPKQLKATFRCALNSKKELKERHRERERRYWQFVDPKTAEKDTTPKKKRKNNKTGRSRSSAMITASYDNDMEKCILSESSSPRIHSRNEVEISRPVYLPPIDSFSKFEPLTPPHQTNENSYNCIDFKLAEEEAIRKENCRSKSRHTENRPDSVASIHAEDNLSGNPNEATVVLPPFETFCNFHILTPPPQENEVYFNPTEYRINYTPPPDQNRLTPSYISPDSQTSLTTDVWQPNSWPIHHTNKVTRVLSDFFFNDFTGLYKSSNQDLENDSTMDFLDMDQHVPINNSSLDVQIHSRNGQTNMVNKTQSNNPSDQMQEMRLDDFLSDNVDLEVCRRLMQEIDITSSLPQSRLPS